MREQIPLPRFLASLLLTAAAVGLFVPGAAAEIVSFSGTVTYTGSYAADTLYVAVLDTNQMNSDVAFLTVTAFPVGSPPLSQPYDLSFDNAQANGQLIVAAALDVDGGGLDTIGNGDVVGWYASTQDPALISPATSQTGLDFSLPLAEVHGTITFGVDQSTAWLDFPAGTDCGRGGFRPTSDITVPGPYAVIGFYPGTYCLRGEGDRSGYGWFTICYGDPTCTNPTTITLTGSQVLTGVDMDYSAFTPTGKTSWGFVKGAYR